MAFWMESQVGDASCGLGTKDGQDGKSQPSVGSGDPLSSLGLERLLRNVTIRK
jgi:hypothetical protein